MFQLKRALFLACLTTLALPCAAEGVRIVGSPEIRYFEVYDAIAAAADGDVILVGAGTYQGFTIDGKSLTIATLPGNIALIEGTVTVQNLPATGRVLLLGLNVQAPASPNNLAPADPGLRLTNNAGHVRIARSSFKGGLGGTHGCGYTAGGPGGDGAALDTNLRAVFVDCVFQGGAGYGSCCTCIYSSGGPGGDGINAVSSATALYRCTVTGGVGGTDGSLGGHGGHGYAAVDFGIFASGSTFTGGKGGDAWDFVSTTGGNGGDGMNLSSLQAHLLDNTFVAGKPGSGIPYPGQPGQPITGNAAVTQYPGPARLLLGNDVVSGSSSYTLTVQGVPGEKVFLSSSRNLGFGFIKLLTGVWLVPVPVLVKFTPDGVIPGGGSLVLSIPTHDLATPTALVTVQALLVSGTTATLTGPLSQVLLDRNSAPDCTGNAVSDFVDLIEGTSFDANTDLIPDECQYKGPDWYVDASAPVGGDGSQAAPFREVRPALQNAFSGHTVHVADGLYTGATNRGLEFFGHDVVVKSDNGPANCILDCQGIEPAFVIHSGESPAARIEGFTIRNGMSTTNGGGIQISGLSSPTIEGCVILNCTAESSGGGIYAIGGSPQIRNTTVLACKAKASGNNSGGGGIALVNSNGSIERCTLESNTVSASGSGGGAFLRIGNATSFPSISHCVVRGNSAYLNGGGIFVQSFTALPARVTNCLVVGNSARTGGGVMVIGGSGPVELCTIASNTATTQGGGLCVFDGSGHPSPGYTLSNSILWGNSSPLGAQIRIYGNNSAKLSVDYCDVQGGQAGVSVQGTLTWGAGNLDLDPKFVDNFAYRLLATSPCIDAGDNARVPLDVLDIDGDGNTTELLPIDLDGLARFRDVASVPNTGNGTPPIVDMGPYELAAP